jgi:putative transcriptional regulator
LDHVGIIVGSCLNDFQNIFSVYNETLWKNKLLQKGGEYKLWANAPSDINQN